MPRMNELLYRNFELDEIEVRKLVEGRTVPVSFSSEMSIPRWFGREILSHRQGHVQKGRVKTTLFNHNANAIVGPFLNERYEDGIGRGDIQFDETPDGELRMKQVQSGSLRGVSVGYLVEKYRKLKPGEEFELASGKAIGTADEEGGPTYVAVRWSTSEVSLTPIPADISVGVGRELTRTLDGIEIEEAQAALPPEDETDKNNGGDREMEEKEIEKKVQDAVTTREAEIKKIMLRVLDRAEALGKGPFAMKMWAEGKTEDEITDAIIKETAKERGKSTGGGGDDDPQVRTLDKIDDETFVRGLVAPSMLSL